MILTIPAKLNGFPELQAAVVELTSNALEAADGGITYAEAQKILFSAAPVFVEIVRQYSDLSGEQKKQLVDEAMKHLLRAIGPKVAASVLSLAVMALPWYAKPVAWLLSFLVQADVVGAIAAEIPQISQAAYDGLIRVWSRLGVPKK